MIAITGGGTGGHLSIAKAVAESYNKIGVKPVFIGSTYGQDLSWFEGSSLFGKTIFLSSYGVVNQGFFGKIKSLLNILKLSFETKKILKKEGIAKVFAVGGYSSAPASFAAVFSGIPLFIHEQNAYMGKLNRILKFFAKEVFSSYEENSKIKDYPVSEEWFKLRKNRSSLRSVAFLGGSQGAKFINELAMTSASWLFENNVKIIHQTGVKEEERVREFYNKHNITADIFSFFSPLSEKLKDVDFAVARSGAGTMWELAAAGIPACFIPFPHAAKNHQYFNAKVLEAKNAAIVVEQSDMNAKMLISIFCETDIEAMNANLANIIEPHGADKIVKAIESL